MSNPPASEQQSPDEPTRPGGVTIQDIHDSDIRVEGDIVGGDKTVFETVINMVQANPKPILFLLIPILLGVTALLYLQLRPAPRPAKMAGTFNIAIAPFESIADGRSQPTEEGERAAQWLATELRNQQPSFPAGSSPEIWGPEQTGRIAGGTRAERAAAAADLARQVGAQIIVYGTVSEIGGQTAVSPEFYVQIDEFFGGQEIAGPHQLGAPIPVAANAFDNPVLSADLNRELNGRALALAHFTTGLIYFSLDRYQEAYDAFAAANDVPGWESEPGKEVIYLFLGNAALNTGDFAAAHQWFARSITANPNYARGYIGQGLTYYQEAILPLSDPEEPRLDQETLNAAIVAFERALAAPDQPPLADVPAKVHFGLGRAYLVQSWQGDVDRWEAAEAELLLVTAAYEAGDVQIQELAAQAYGQLGLLNFILGHDEAAIAAFEQALALGRYDLYKRQWAASLSQIYAEQGDATRAAEYATQAEQ